ncbi:unnamed protein product [Paramecium primaurelia]|uniref:Transmembrane protein n=1 Tax=Paramecium primaurelia TaxID=5886 RepID=A0A8S1JNW0_PARPR|nr:unnamed protein product [Paramecium primaurelia]
MSILQERENNNHPQGSEYQQIVQIISQPSVENWRRYTFTIKEKQYVYQGPLNEETEELIQVLQNYENAENVQAKNAIESLSKKWLDYEKKLYREWSCFNQRLKFDTNQIIITIVYWSAYFSVLSESLDVKNNSNVQNDSKRSDIAQYMPLYAFLFTLFSQICYQIKNIYIWILLFISLIIIPLFVLLGYHLNAFSNNTGPSDDYIGIGFCILSFLIFINSLLNKGFNSIITSLSSSLIATLFNCSFCILVIYFILFKIIAFFLLLQTNNTAYIIESISDLIAPQIFIIMLVYSIFVIKALFTLSPENIESDLKILSLKDQPDSHIQKEYYSYKLNKKVIDILKQLKLTTVAPILIAISYFTLEIYCYSGWLYFKSIQNYELTVTYGFLFIAIPIFMSFGICMSTSDVYPQNLYLYSSLLLGAIFSILTIQVWNLTYDIQYFQSISRLFGICPLIITLIWLTVAYFRSWRRNQKMLVLIISCYFFAFPIGILITLSDAFNNLGIYYGSIVLIIIGCIPIIGLIIYYFIVIMIYLIKLPQQALNLNFYAFQYVNLTNLAIWFNSIFYILGFYFTCYFVLNEPATATGTKKGAMQGLLVIQTVLFILTKKALQVRINDHQNDQKEEQIKYLERIDNLIRGGIFYPFVILLPIGLTQDNETTKNALISNAVGLPVVFIYFNFLIYLKKELNEYQDFFQPLIIILMWIFVIGPIGIIFPILADIYENSSYQFAVFAQLAVAYTILITIIIITCISNVYSVLLNKEQLEMKKKEVLKIVMQLLANHKVSSTEEICTLIFLRYIQQNNPIKLKNDLKQGDPVNVYDYPGVDKGRIFDEQLVTKTEFENKKKLEQISKKKKGGVIRSLQDDETELFKKSTTNNDDDEQDNLSHKILDIVFECVFCRCGFEEMEQINKNKQQLDVEILELENWKEREAKKIQGIIQPSEAEMKTASDIDFYTALRTKYRDRTERFWAAIYTKFRDNLNVVLEYLELERNDEILKQYKTFKVIDDGDFTMSQNDFALFLYDNFQRGDQTNYYNLIWEMAVKKYHLFVYNYNDIRQILKLLQNNTNTPFHQKNFKLPNNKGEKRQKLEKKKVVQSNDQIDLQYQQKKQNIEREYQDKVPKNLKVQFWSFCSKVNEILWIKPRIYTQQLVSQLINSLFQKITPPEPEQDKIVQNVKWEQLAELVGDCLVDQCNKFDKKIRDQEFILKFTSTNIIAVFLRIYDLYGLATLAFDSQVGWFGQSQTINPIEFVDYSAIWSEYNLFFFLALFMSLIYIILGFEAAKQIANNTFGFDENGIIATYKSRRYWLSKTIQIVSGQFIFVMKSYIDAFICDYSSYPYTLVRQPSVECMSDLHFMYVTLAIFGCIIYYPLSSYLQPTFQYMDHSLDLKYKSNYVVLYIQSKLLILGMSSVFSNLQDQAYQYQMLFSSIVMLILIYFHIRIKPCYVKWFNTIELCILLLLLYMYFGAFLILATGLMIIGWIILACMGGLTLILTAILLLKHYNKEKQLELTKVQPVNQATEMTQILKQ